MAPLDPSSHGGDTLLSQTSTPKSVLIVDESDDARHVLRTVLSRRGIEIIEASAGTVGLQLARDLHPDLIVVDADGKDADHAICDAFADHADAGETPVIFLGAVRRHSGPSGDCVSKPYQYGPLIHKIEELLAATNARRRCA